MASGTPSASASVPALGGVIVEAPACPALGLPACAPACAPAGVPVKVTAGAPPPLVAAGVPAEPRPAALATAAWPATLAAPAVRTDWTACVGGASEQAWVSTAHSKPRAKRYRRISRS